MKTTELNEVEFDEALAFYKQQGYTGGIDPSDTTLVTRINKKIIGLVRISKEHKLEILRGMYIDLEFQRKGLGKKILALLESHFTGVEAYCVPFSHLEGFYATIGFEKIESKNAPAFLQERLEIYIAQGASCIIMKRMA